MEEGIVMMTIGQTNSEPQFPWWVSQVSTDEDKLGAFKARADSTSLARGTLNWPNSLRSQIRFN